MDTLHISRIKYESFSKFSTELNNSRSLEDVKHCLCTYLKYLFNYHFFRLNYSFREKEFININCTLKDVFVDVLTEPQYYIFEEELINSGKPIHIPGYDIAKSGAHIPVEIPGPADLWGWNFKYMDRQIVATLITGESKPFGPKDIQFLKLVAENVESKLLELCLIKELDNVNKKVSDINARQRKIIKKRTKEVEEQNEVLLEISIHNAHKIREPLTRIMGLIELVDEHMTMEELLQEIVPRLRKSSADFDEVLQDHISRSTQFLTQLKENIAKNEDHVS